MKAAAKFRSHTAIGLFSPIIATVLLFVVWQIIAGNFVPTYFIASPALTFQHIRDWADSGILWSSLITTVEGTVIAFALATVSAVALALVLTEIEFLDEVFEPIISALFAIPYVAFAPALVIIFGVGHTPAIALGWLISFFMIFFQTYAGAKSLGADLRNMSAMLGATHLQRALKVRLPAAMPFIAEGLSVGLIYAFHGEVLGEMMASNSGLGYQILFASTQLDSGGVVAGLLVLGVFALLLIGALGLAQRRLPAGTK